MDSVRSNLSTYATMADGSENLIKQKKPFPDETEKGWKLVGSDEGRNGRLEAEEQWLNPRS